MIESRRDFAKKLAMATVGVTVVSTTTLLASSKKKDNKGLSNGVVVGSSNKKEIIYSKTNAWNEYYRNAL